MTDLFLRASNGMLSGSRLGARYVCDPNHSGSESHTVPVEHMVAAGDEADRISEYARRFAVGLVVLGSPETELTEEDLDTSTVLQVIAKVGCPVLCLALPGATSGELKSDVALASGFSV